MKTTQCREEDEAMAKANSKLVRIVVGFEAEAERNGRLTAGDIYTAVNLGAQPQWDTEYTARWDGYRGVRVFD